MRLLRRALPLLLFAWATSSQATAIRLDPDPLSPRLGSQFSVGLVADIDPADEIIGFGFDLIASPNVAFIGFTPGSGFADDPVYLAPFSDSDGIRGAVGGDLLGGAPVSGNVLLGTLRLRALALGPALVSLTADDLAANFTEGLIPVSIDLVNFLPPITDAAFNIVPSGVPEPQGLVPLALAMMVAGGAARRRYRGASATPS